VSFIISFFFYGKSIILLFDKSASPISVLVDSSDLFHREYDEKIEYLTYKMRSIKKQVSIEVFFTQYKLAKRDAGVKGKNFVLLKRKLVEAILLVTVYRINKYQLYEEVN
jgi:hypothetical protein